MAPRLEVFVTSDGLTDYVMATSSRAADLEARRAKLDREAATLGKRQTDERRRVEDALKTVRRATRPA